MAASACIENIKEKLEKTDSSESPFPKPPKQPDIVQIKYTGKELTRINKFIKQEGYVKKKEIPKKKDTSAEKQFKIAMLTFALLVASDLIIFLSNAIVDGQWAFTPILWQILLMSAIKDVSVGIVGKMIKYYNSELDEAELSKK